MKQRLLLFALTLSLMAAIQTPGNAQQRSLEEMQRIASERFTSGHNGAKLAKGKAVGVLATYSNETFTVFAPEAGEGFVIVSTNEQMPEVLGACYDATFDVERTKNPGLNALLDNYAKASEMISNGEASAAELFGTSANIISAGSANNYLAPMLGSIAFDQESPYNMLCPMIHDSLCMTGCGPTALAQLLMYNKYPKHGTGNIKYTTSTRKINVSFDFENTTFDWAHMKDTYGGCFEPKTTVLHTYLDSIKQTFALFFDNVTPYAVTASGSNGKLIINNIFNDNASPLSGYVQFIIANGKGVCRHASLAYKRDFKKRLVGYTSISAKMNFPNDIEDGEYKLFVGFSSDSVNYTIACKKDASPYYLDVTKSGNTYTCPSLGKTFVAASTYEEAKPVATLMKACGAAVQADYGPVETSAKPINLWGAASTIFGYDPDIYFVSNSFLTANEMAKAAKNELDAGRLVPVTGRCFVKNDPKTGEPITEGHAYIIDGYDLTGENPMFHINWGWNGSSNSYFLLTMMQPSQAGAGGRTDNYSYGYDFFMNVTKDNKKEDGWAISCDSIKLNNSRSNITCSRGDKVTVGLHKLANSNVIHRIDEKVYLYLVSEEGTANKITSYYLSDSLDPGQYFKGWKSLNIEIPSNLAYGTYHVECRLNENDHFFCHANPALTLNDPEGIENVQSDANDEAAVMLDLYGRRTINAKNGIVIRNGKKILFGK